MEKEFKRNLGALNEVFAFVDDFIAAGGLKEGVAFSVRLAVEELFTNLVRHNCGGRDHISIELNKDSSQFVIRLRDFDVEPFDITEASPIDVRQSLEERRIGGLGIHLVRSIVDKLTYEYEDRTLCVTATKKLEGKDV